MVTIVIYRIYYNNYIIQTTYQLHSNTLVFNVNTNTHEFIEQNIHCIDHSLRAQSQFTTNYIIVYITIRLHLSHIYHKKFTFSDMTVSTYRLTFTHHMTIWPCSLPLPLSLTNATTNEHIIPIGDPITSSATAIGHQLVVQWGCVGISSGESPLGVQSYAHIHHNHHSYGHRLDWQ